MISWIFLQVGAGHIRPNTKSKVYKNINLLFPDVPENLRAPTISASSLDDHVWSKQSSTYFEVLFAFANANLYDNNIIAFAHSADLDIFRLIYNWAHTKVFYVAVD